MATALTPAEVVEILATGATLTYLLLLIREKIACWAFGIAGCLLSVYLFIDARLYFQAVLYFFYAAMGVWGWMRWHRRLEDDRNPVVLWRVTYHLHAIVIACFLALGLGYAAQHYSDAERPVFDAFITTFSFLGTYLEVTKVLEAWIYWLVINLASVWLYHDRGLENYAILMGIYSAMSVWGFLSWLRTLQAQPAAAS